MLWGGRQYFVNGAGVQITGDQIDDQGISF